MFIEEEKKSNTKEDEIIEYSESIAAFLWKHEYRKIDNEDQ